MTLVMISLRLAHVFQCLFTFMLIGGNLTAQLKGKHRGIGGRIQGRSQDFFRRYTQFSKSLCATVRMPTNFSLDIPVYVIQDSVPH